MSNRDLVFAGALNGRVYAFAADGGKILWQDQTARPFEAVNGIDAHGGAIDNGGVQLAGDTLFVLSGYSLFGQMPGNVLLAYRVARD
jgi:polyvinyl alcohol dehydrogenase (cytochrome)